MDECLHQFAIGHLRDVHWDTLWVANGVYKPTILTTSAARQIAFGMSETSARTSAHIAPLQMDVRTLPVGVYLLRNTGSGDTRVQLLRIAH